MADWLRQGQSKTELFHFSFKHCLHQRKQESKIDVFYAIKSFRTAQVIFIEIFREFVGFFSVALVANLLCTCKLIYFK